MSYATDKMKNIAIAGHGQTGKTTLFEHMLFAGGVVSKAETVESGKTVSDSSPEEIERKISIHAVMGHIDRNGTKINIFDTPGSSDFAGDVISSFRACEFALLAVDGRSGVQIETVKLWRNLDKSGKPRGIFVTKLDNEQANFDKALADIKEKLNIEPVPITLPMGSGGTFKGVVDALHEKAYTIGGDGVEKECPFPDEFKDAVASAKEKLTEAAAEGDDSLMERYIEQGSLSADDMKIGLVEALAEHKYVPVFAGSALKNSGIISLVDFIADVGPNPRSANVAAVLDSEGNTEKVPIDPDKPFSAMVLKTTYDQFSGKLSWIKVVSGKLAADTEVYNISEGKKERIGKLFICQGKKLEEINELCAGDVGIITKSATLKTNDTIAATDGGKPFVPLSLPEPIHSVAVNALAKKDDDKLGEFLVRAAEEDKTFRYNYNGETKETVISGMGELQINIILDKIKHNQK